MFSRKWLTKRLTEKGAADYVTNVDVAVQNYLKEALGKELPDIALIAEEKENLGLNSRKSYWILDPIDGTTNLIRDYHLSAVSLGLYENGEITFGVVYNPFTEELFYGAKGEGAYLNGTLSMCPTSRNSKMLWCLSAPLLMKKTGQRNCSRYFTIFL